MSARVKLKLTELQIKQAAECRDLPRKLEDLELSAHKLEAAKAEVALWDDVTKKKPTYVTLNDIGPDPELNLSDINIKQNVHNCDAIFPVLPKDRINAVSQVNAPKHESFENIAPKKTECHTSDAIAPMSKFLPQQSTAINCNETNTTRLTNNSEVLTLIKHLNRPKPEIITFDGNPMDY